MVAILILNWNGYEDTIDCLKSLSESENNNYFVIVGDNGSANNSIDRIIEGCKKLSIPLVPENSDVVPPRGVIVKDLKHNNGFAKGNNLMIQYAQKFHPDYYLLLNNDTVVDKSFLTHLLEFKEDHPDYDVLTPLILYYYDKAKVWNAGGRLRWGSRKYFYANKQASSIKEKELISCSFVTGCALFFSPAILCPDGKVFTEQFFFGEEDFEFSLRMKDESKKIACVLQSKIYHKVGASTKTKTKNLKKNYVHYLNRYIDMRQHMKPSEFFVWRSLNNVYIFFLLLKKGNSIKEVRDFMWNLNREAYLLDSVSKEKFEFVLNVK